MNVEAYLAEMQPITESLLREVAKALNGAPDGAWTNAGEMQAGDMFCEYRRRAYEVALQMRTDAAEAAFSPVDPLTKQRLRNKGIESRSTVTVNGRVVIKRRRWQIKGVGHSAKKL